MQKDSCLRMLAEALKERLHVIADHQLRDRNPTEHLKQLQSISEKIERLVTELPDKELDPHFRHYLRQRSYEKALAWIEAQID